MAPGPGGRRRSSRRKEQLRPMAVAASESGARGSLWLGTGGHGFIPGRPGRGGGGGESDDRWGRVGTVPPAPRRGE